MSRRFALAAAMLWIAAGALSAHELFLRLESFFLAPNAHATIDLRYGEFILSDSMLAPDRLADVRLVGPAGEVVRPPPSAWREHDRTALLDFRTGDSGTYVIGVSAKPQLDAYAGGTFDRHLREDGVLDVLERREREGELGRPAVVRASRHARAILQVGEDKTDSWRFPFGYAAELLPLRNPYDLMLGHTLEVLALVNGEPAPDHLVHANFAGNHQHGPRGGHIEAVQVRTDTAGIARFLLSGRSIWYVRLVHMVESDDPGIDYESTSATLTFQIR